MKFNKQRKDHDKASTGDLMIKDKPQTTGGAWKRAALRVGEELAASGPQGYYLMTPNEWKEWALNAVNFFTARAKSEKKQMQTQLLIANAHITELETAQSFHDAELNSINEQRALAVMLAEKCRKDAARYKWLRDVGDDTWAPLIVRDIPGWGYSQDDGNLFDDALDTAMGPRNDQPLPRARGLSDCGSDVGKG